MRLSLSLKTPKAWTGRYAMCKYPKTELVSISKGIYGGWAVVVLINEDYYQTYHYYGYTKADARQLAKAESMKEASQYFFNEV